MADETPQLRWRVAVPMIWVCDPCLLCVSGMVNNLLVSVWQFRHFSSAPKKGKKCCDIDDALITKKECTACRWACGIKVEATHLHSTVLHSACSWRYH